MFSNLSSSSISFAIETPSFVIRGAPYDFSKITFLPLGPIVTLKDGIKFSNGKTFDAAAAKAAIEYIIKDGNNKRLKTLLNAASIDADGLKLTIHTNGVNAVVPNVLADVNMIMFDVNENSDDYNKGLVGTGPYVLQKKDADGNMDLIRNETYWAGKPAAAAVHTKSGLDTTAQVNAMLNEEIDFVQLSGTQGADISRFEAQSDKFDIQQFDQGRLFYLYINPDAAGTQDAKVREALQYAFDRDAIVSGVYGGKKCIKNMTPSIDNVIISHILKFLAAFFLPLLPLLNVFLIEPIPRLTFKSLKLNLLTIYARTVACIFTCTLCFFFFSFFFLFKLQLPCMNLSFALVAFCYISLFNSWISICM